MAFANKQNGLTAFMQLLMVIFLLSMDATDVRADGPRPFDGEIRTISSSELTVRVVEAGESDLRNNEMVTVLLAPDTRVYNRRNEAISFSRLSTGLVVCVKPAVHPDGDVVAETIRITRRVR